MSRDARRPLRRALSESACARRSPPSATSTPRGAVAERVRRAHARAGGARARRRWPRAPTRPQRARPEPDCGLRTPFQRDRDRIVHCKAFRRLKHKTQVFVAPSGDHYRTRLTHTLEVTQVSRTVARALALNEDLVEAIGLGHDLGHPPFGHIGEDALDRCLRERFGSAFRHHEHSLRVVDTLERDGRGPEPDRAGPRRDRQPLRPGAEPGHPGGQDRPARRPRGLHQPRHRRRRAGRRARRAPICPPSRSRSSATPGRAGSTRWSTISSSTPRRPGTSSRASGSAAAMTGLRDVHVRARVPRAGGHARARQDRPGDPHAVRPLLRPSRGDPGVDPRRASWPPGDRLHRRDDRPLLHQPASRSSASRSRSRREPLHRRLPRPRAGRGRHARAGLGPHRAAPRRRQQLLRAVPVSRRAHAAPSTSAPTRSTTTASAARPPAIRSTS